MAIVGLLHLTSITNPPSSAQTPAAAIISHLSDLHPSQSHEPFHVDHRLFVSTSSLLPQSESRRTFTHIFTSTHSPQKTYISTTTSTSKSEDGFQLATITVPTSASLEPFTALLMQKFQPLWAPRQFLILENGTSIVLPLQDDAKWKISIGDLRLAQSRGSGGGGTQLRGAIIELQCEPPARASNANLNTEESRKKIETLFRGLLKSLFKNIKLDLKIDDVKLYLTQTTSNEVEESDPERQQEQTQKGRVKPHGHEIAELYMDVLRGQRG